jgi:hypothetical protein
VSKPIAKGEAILGYKKTRKYDVVVYGATPGGIGAAIAAARRGSKVALLEPTRQIGGMMTSGLGRTDIPSLEASGSIFREFAGRILRYYCGKYGEDSKPVKDCNNGLYFEPSVAARIFREMLAAEQGVSLHMEQRLVSAAVPAGRLRSIVTAFPEGGLQEWTANAFVDAGYEGDLAAAAGAPYWLGRESRDDWNEEFAGTLYMDYHPDKEVLKGSTGEGDERIQAYNFRLCLTQNPLNRVPFRHPPDYRGDEYESLIDDVRSGRIGSIRDVLSITVVPNDKFDANNHHYCLCSSDLPGENGGYPEGAPEERALIAQRHRSYMEGLLWFLQTDERLPESFRQETASWGYAADEFTDNGYFPYQLYVREARRIQGEYVFSENDARLSPGLGRAPIHADSIAVGAYQIDSHAVRKREPEGQNRTLEGFLGLRWLTAAYQIPFGVMVPLRIDGLIVPVAVSATHIGFGTIRMEPCWMQLGYAAGVAAELVAQTPVSEFRTLCIDRLQDELLADDQRISMLNDVEWSHPSRAAAEYFAAKGVLKGYEARLEEPVTVRDASLWLARARSLTGGRRLPALPASDRILPAGEDMGPRHPRKEPQADPEAYWKEHPYLPAQMATRWRKAACRTLGQTWRGTDAAEGNDGFVTRGDWLSALYEALKETRRNRQSVAQISN